MVEMAGLCGDLENFLMEDIRAAAFLLFYTSACLSLWSRKEAATVPACMRICSCFRITGRGIAEI
jgi:hypothetical protein